MHLKLDLLLLIRVNGRWEMGSLASWSVLMKTILIPLVSILAVFATAQIKAGDHFLQMRCERSRRCLPRYDYQASKATAVSAVISEPAIVIVTPATPGSADPATPNAQHVSSAFVFDELRAGPLVLTSLSAKTDGTGRIRVSGVLNHTGGDSGQLLGGKAVICVEPLTATGSTAKNATTLAVQDDGDWVRRNQPKTVQMDVQYENTHPWTFGDVERVRVFLEYYPSR